MDNHKEIRNIIHNELKLTKKEIKEQVDQAIQDIVERTVTPQFIENVMQKHIERVVEEAFQGGSRYWSENLKDRVSHKISDELGSIIANSLDVTLKIKGEEVGNGEATGNTRIAKMNLYKI